MSMRFVALTTSYTAHTMNKQKVIEIFESEAKLARNCWDSSPTSAWLLSDGYPAQLAQDRRHLAHRYPDTVVQGMGAREYAIPHTVRRRSVLARIDLRVLPA